MRAYKKTRDGFGERLALLQGLHAAAESLVTRAFWQHGGFDATRDDVMDAMILALTGRYGAGALLTLPLTPQRDARGLPMEIVYAARP